MTYTTEDAHMSRVARDMFLVQGEKNAITGFEAFSLLNWLDLAPHESNRSIVSMLSHTAGITYEEGKAIVLGKATIVKIDGLKMNVPARKTTFEGIGL